MHDLTFGFSLQPTTDIGAHRELAAAADALRLDLMGIQDHPYIADFVDTFTLADVLLAATENIAVFPDVASRTPRCFAPARRRCEPTRNSGPPRSRVSLSNSRSPGSCSGPSSNRSNRSNFLRARSCRPHAR